MNDRSRQVILFYSPQGGSGKSTLAVNTAIFASMSGSRTLLVDMAVYGGVMSMLRIPQKGGCGLSSVITFLELGSDAEEPDELCKILSQSIVESNINKNLDVLISAPPIRMEAVNEKYAKAIIGAVRKLGYSRVIVDTSSELSEKNLSLIDSSDLIIIPVIQDISCGWKLLMFKEIMDRCGIRSDRVSILINKCSKYSGFNNYEFSSETGYEAVGEVPLFLKDYQSYINQGKCITTVKNKKAYKTFEKISRSILDGKKAGAVYECRNAGKAQTT